MPEAVDHAGTVIATPANSLAQDPEMVSDFICESREHLASMESQMLVLEQNPADMEALHSAFRGFHTIKGLAGFLQLPLVQEVAHEVELESVDYLKQAVEAVETA